MNGAFKYRGYSVALLVLASFIPVRTHAHSMYQSAVMLDFIGGEIHAELQLPLERLSAAFGKPINSRTLDREESSLTVYILSRFHAQSADGQAFQTQLRSPPTITTVDGASYVIADVILVPPAHSRVDVFDIEDNVILDCIRSQVALVSIRSDWNASIFANDPQLVGVLRSSSRSITIDRSDGSWFRGFGSVFHLGVRHIAEGTDHLLFLLTLLLPAPLLAFAQHWAAVAGARDSFLRILKIVTAFTMGHSITLALAALGLMQVPSRPIEVLIAVSILVSAVHALRPLFPGREAGIAAFFGLIHGLAFAATLGELGLGRWERVASIFAFNLGIETMQLVVVAATLPSLMLLSRTACYSAFRICGALFAGLASLGWIAERLFGIHTRVDFVVDGLAHNAVVIAATLFAISLVACLPYFIAGRRARTLRRVSEPVLERI